MKTEKQKQLVIDYLKKTPIIQVVADKVGIHRSTIYRWKLQDEEFANDVDEALDQGISLMNDYAESMLIHAIKERNLTATFYWLNHRHPAYETRVKIKGSLKHSVEKLDDEQNALVMKSLIKAGLLPDSEQDNE